MSKSLKPKPAELETLLDDVMTRLRDIAESTGEKSEEALQAAAKGLAKSARALGAHAKAQAKGTSAKAVKAAKDHPIATAAIAATTVATAAAVVALLLRRSRKD